MKLIWIDEKRNHYISEKDLLERVSACEQVPCYIQAADPLDMLLQLLAGMVHGLEMVLLDADYSEKEMADLGMDINCLTECVSVQPTRVSTMTEMVNLVLSKPWKLWMFTSGTTGLPKKVCHSYTTLGRNVRKSERHNDDIWAFAYRFSHMAGIQVLLQAISNANTMVYVFEEEPRRIVELMEKYRCTHISATPTFYRNIIAYLRDNTLQLQHLTTGGEKYDEDLCNKLQTLLPNVKMHNIYASTETGSILNAVGRGFSVPEQYKEKVKISSVGELLIHCSLLGDFPLDGEWYNTHDLVEEKDGLLFFISRKSDLLNVGGYKVNPLEVEAAMQRIPGINDCLVYGQKNSVLGTILLADVVLEKDYSEKDVKKAIRQTLSEELQDFKIPRIIKVVDEIRRTKSGKKVRK